MTTGQWLLAESFMTRGNGVRWTKLAYVATRPKVRQRRLDRDRHATELASRVRSHQVLALRQRCVLLGRALIAIRVLRLAILVRWAVTSHGDEAIVACSIQVFASFKGILILHFHQSGRVKHLLDSFE